MKDAKKAVESDLAYFVANGGLIKYPFPIEDFALRTFGLDIQYEDFDDVFESAEYDPKELFGCLYPDRRFFQGIDKLILINTNRKPFELAGKQIDPIYWADYAERQTIAHEVGHYSDQYRHNVDTQLDLFEPTIFADAATSVIVYPVGEETFANKYSRELLMPSEIVIKFINKRGITGTFDLNSIIVDIKKKFGVTQFMIEIRLNELGIHFYNGVYIKNRNRFPYVKYTEDDLLTLIDVVKKYSLTHPYYDADNFVREYNMATGETRASAPLYYAFNRIIKGKYDSKFPSVFEKRITELADFDINKFTARDDEEIE